MIKQRNILLSAAAGALLSTNASASMLDFETGLTDNQLVSRISTETWGSTTPGNIANPFVAYQIEFVSPTADNRLYIEKTGGANPGPQNGPVDGDPEGFVNDVWSTANTTNPQWDTSNEVANGPSLGQFFLRSAGITQTYTTPGNPGLNPNDPTFFINLLTAPTSSISGEIWDIDGVNNTTEQWVVSAFTGLNGSGSSLGSATSPSYGSNGSSSLDARAWDFIFDQNLDQIQSLKFAFTGNKTQGIGVAFDNFSTGIPVIQGEEPPAVVPVPAAIWLFGSALGVAGMFSRRGGAKK